MALRLRSQRRFQSFTRYDFSADLALLSYLRFLVGYREDAVTIFVEGVPNSCGSLERRGYGVITPKNRLAFTLPRALVDMTGTSTSYLMAELRRSASIEYGKGEGFERAEYSLFEDTRTKVNTQIWIRMASRIRLSGG